MSTTIEDKITLFTKVLLERVEHEFEEKRKKIIEEYEQQEKQLAEEYRHKSKSALDDAVKEANLKKRQIESKTLSECRLMIIKKRQEFIDRIMEEAKKKSWKLLDTPAYAGFLKNAVKQATLRLAEQDEAVYCLTKHDMAKFKKEITELIKQLRQGKAFRLEEGGDEMIGGVFVESGNGHIQINCTIASSIEESRQFIGQLLAQRLAWEEETDDQTR